MTLPADVLIAETISPAEATKLVDDFTWIGLAAELRVVATRRSLGDVAWLLLAALPVQPFFARLAEDFAADAYLRLKAFVTKVLHRDTRAGEAPPLVLQDTATGVQIVLEPDLPSEAYHELLYVDLTTVRPGPLHYDLHRHRWRSELAEAAQTRPSEAPDAD